MANGQPKPTFYVAVFIVILGLVGLALYRYGSDRLPESDRSDLRRRAEADAERRRGARRVGDHHEEGIQLRPGHEAARGQGHFELHADGGPYRPVRDQRVGRLGADHLRQQRLKAGKVWKTPSGKDFKVELVLIDDPVAMRDAFAAGNVHIGWATLDMVPLFMEGLRKDSRVMPRVYQQVDWSNGGDGIVVRDTIKTMTDLRGKTVVLAQNSPSHYFLLNALINGGVQPAEVNFKFTQDAFQAAAAFNADRNLAGVVSWAPDIYNLEKVKGNKIIVTTATANKLIADVWFARADFAKDNPDVMEGIVRGIFDGMQDLKNQDAKQKVSKLMARRLLDSGE